MTDRTSICPRCRSTVPGGAMYCPRCGLCLTESGVTEEPVTVKFSGRSATVHELIFHGDICNLYRCTISSPKQTGVFKIARTDSANHLVLHESQVLKHLHAADVDGRFGPFLPVSAGTLHYLHGSDEPPRAAEILTYNSGIENPNELYSLTEVRSVHRGGIDNRDMAWMWRRLLTILGHVHAQHLVHCAITPDHVLIEPKEHKLVLIGWCASVSVGQSPKIRSARWEDWNRSNGPHSERLDLAQASKTMKFLLDDRVEPAVLRHLERATDTSAGAFDLLDDFDRLINALWGERSFRPFDMPPRRHLNKE